MRNWKTVDNPSVIAYAQKAKLEKINMLENEVFPTKRYVDDLCSGNSEITVYDMMDMFLGKIG